MIFPTQEQFEKYIQCADLELGPECKDEWVETIRHILRDLAAGRCTITYGTLYSWGGGSGRQCKDN